MDALVSTNCARACEGIRISFMLHNVPTLCYSSHTAQPVCWRAMSPPQVPDTWHQGAGKKSWSRVMQFLHVDALCRLCSCVIAVLHTHSSVRASSLAAARAQTQTRCISLSPSGSATPHVPWRYFPETLHRWFVKSVGPGVSSGTALQRLADAQGMVCLQLYV